MADDIRQRSGRPCICLFGNINAGERQISNGINQPLTVWTLRNDRHLQAVQFHIAIVSPFNVQNRRVIAMTKARFFHEFTGAENLTLACVG